MARRQKNVVRKLRPTPAYRKASIAVFKCGNALDEARTALLNKIDKTRNADLLEKYHAELDKIDDAISHVTSADWAL